MVSMNVYNDMQGDFKVHERRLTKVEDDLKATDHKCQENMSTVFHGMYYHCQV